MKKQTKGKIIKYCALGIDVIVPLVATVIQFPIWVEQSAEATVSGLFVMFAFLSAVPFISQIREYMKSPSAPMMWGIALVMLTLLRDIIKQMIFVCLCGFIANILGAILYKIGEHYEGNGED